MEADIILTNGTVITMNTEREVLPEGAVVIQGDKIIAVGPSAELAGQYQAQETVDCSGQAVIPGLINAHTHVPMSLLRGLADDLRLDVWLYGYMFPVENQFVGPEFCYWGTLLSCAEMIRSGVTCFADMYYFEDEVAQATAQVGMRAVCAETIMKMPTPNAATYEDGLRYCREFMERWKDYELIVATVGPHAPYTCTPEILQESARLAIEYDVPLLTHLAESSKEVEDSEDQYHMTPIAWVDEYGLLEARVVAAHCVHATERDMRLMARKGVGVVHNPTSNLKLASGVADVVRMLELGIRLAIGTDGPASNNNQDMFEEMRLTALLPKGFSSSPTAVPARQALAMATIGGAQVLRLDHLTGSLEAGKKADIAVIDLGGPHVMPRFQLSDDNLYSQLVYASKSSDVRHVLVNGRFLMRDRQLLTMDETEVIAQAQRMAQKVNTFLARREEDLLDKMVAIGGLEEREIYEVQVKAEVDEEAILAALHRPPVEIVRRSEYEQYDTYFLFADQGKGHLRYREDIPVGHGVEVKPGYSLTLRGPTREREYADSVILSRLRFRSAADRSLRFYREYFQPDEIKEIIKHRRRFHIMYKGVRFEINLDRLLEPKHEQLLLEIKSRTWSSRDAERKAQLLTELLDVLGVDRERLIKREYVDF